MGEVAKISDFSKEVQIFLSPTSRQKEIAAYAVGALAAAQIINRRVLGRYPSYLTTVDGRLNAALTLVNLAHGVIEFEFQITDQAVLKWIADQLNQHSPTDSDRRYITSHVLLADGVPVDVTGKLLPAQKFVFVNTQPYARKIERGASSQAPDGVYQAVSILAQRKFPNSNIRFGYMAAESSWSQSSSAAKLAKKIRRGNVTLHPEWLSRQPAITVSDT